MAMVVAVGGLIRIRTPNSIYRAHNHDQRPTRRWRAGGVRTANGDFRAAVRGADRIVSRLSIVVAEAERALRR